MLTKKEQDLLGRIFISKDSPQDPEKLIFWKIIDFTTDEKDGQRKAIVRRDSKIKNFTLETDCYINEEDLEKNAMFVDNIIRGIWRACQGNF